MFIANRAAKLLKNLSIEQWRLVEVVENPAEEPEERPMKDSGSPHDLPSQHGCKTIKISGQNRGVKRTEFDPKELLVLWQQKHKLSKHFNGTATAASLESETSSSTA